MKVQKGNNGLCVSILCTYLASSRQEKGHFFFNEVKKQITVQWCKHIKKNPDKEWMAQWESGLSITSSSTSPRKHPALRKEAVKIFLNTNLSEAASLLLAVAEMDEEEEVADIREQIFHNTVREHIVSGGSFFNSVFIAFDKVL